MTFLDLESYVLQRVAERTEKKRKDTHLLREAGKVAPKSNTTPRKISIIRMQR